MAFNLNLNFWKGYNGVMLNSEYKRTPSPILASKTRLIKNNFFNLNYILNICICVLYTDIFDLNKKTAPDVSLSCKLIYIHIQKNAGIRNSKKSNNTTKLNIKFDTWNMEKFWKQIRGQPTWQTFDLRQKFVNFNICLYYALRVE